MQTAIFTDTEHLHRVEWCDAYRYIDNLIYLTYNYFKFENRGHGHAFYNDVIIENCHYTHGVDNWTYLKLTHWVEWHCAHQGFVVGFVVGSPCKMGSHSMTELLINTMPFLDTVAGDALSMLCTSNIILQFGAMEIRSPLASVRVLLSSRTELRFSIQMASTGPSRTIQICSPCNGTACVRNPYIQILIVPH